MTQRVLTANRLSDGLVVYLGAGGAWTTSLPDADLASDEQSEARLTEIGEHAAADQQIVDPYLIDVTAENGTRRPVRFREAIRADGPTVETRVPDDPKR